MNTLENFRKEKDEFFAQDAQSPLEPDQKRHFRGLNYFPENLELRVEVPVEEFPNPEKVQIQTSTGDVQTYLRYGKVEFKVEGQPVELTLYQGSGEYFMPFVDSLAGKETYGAGRYLEPQVIGKGKLLLDFNYAYNPYCAYNEYWSCPITPPENRLKVPIRAGEKVFLTEDGVA